MTQTMPPPVALALTAAGWQPGRRDDEAARRWGLLLASYNPPYPFFPAAAETLARFGGLRIDPVAPGGEIAASGMHLDPLLAVHSPAALASLARRVGARLTPIGRETGGPGLLAVSERGEIFVLDHGGDWFAGQSIEDALVTLLTGRRPARVPSG
ncbi:MAG: hypothetical protein QOD41_4125 [Cryptosporangiaceae bacterium]|nr:hypothetical protein [Cryptosporangiaceae bacterium]